MAMRIGFCLAAWLLSFCLALQAHAGEIVTVGNGERNVDLFWQALPEAKGTLLMFSGGGGGFGSVLDGVPTNRNFLVRTMGRWSARGFNVAYFGDLNAPRLSSQHIGDIRAALRWIEQTSPAPVYLVGTSAGTVSAAYAAVSIPDARIQGLVLTSTMQEVAAMDGLQELAIPVLDVSHAYDSCKSTSPGAGRGLIAGLKNAPRKEYIEVKGGISRGDPCQAMAYHGFNGIEDEVVGLVADWLLRH